MSFDESYHLRHCSWTLASITICLLYEQQGIDKFRQDPRCQCSMTCIFYLLVIESANHNHRFVLTKSSISQLKWRVSIDEVRKNSTHSWRRFFFQVYTETAEPGALSRPTNKVSHYAFSCPAPAADHTPPLSCLSQHALIRPQTNSAGAALNKAL